MAAFQKKSTADFEVIQSTDQVCGVVSIKNDRQVVIRFTEPVAVSKRGGFLLDLEAALQKNLTKALLFGLRLWAIKIHCAICAVLR
jgi:hypothetical protein